MMKNIISKQMNCTVGEPSLYNLRTEWESDTVQTYFPLLAIKRPKLSKEDILIQIGDNLCQIHIELDSNDNLASPTNGQMNDWAVAEALELCVGSRCA